ncbi:MAG: tRNA lysidine(34) synthetase TilS [Clostridiales bacterium]|nr:tRNA lysidine(34) synthetase TilS [Clostridiales bacterium]
MSIDIGDKIIYAINKYNMLKENRPVVIGVSGGADSMCLLHFLFKNAEMLKIRVIAAHLNHNIRGDEALRDESFVREYCEKNKIDFVSKSVDIPLLSKQLKLSTEEAGRNARYNFFNELAKDDGVIATAHTASDNAETVLFNAVRGSGINGICGIKPKRDNIIRPLILLTREETEQYCAQNCVPYVIDSTNLDDSYTRNKIRHNIITRLTEINPAAVQNLSLLSQSAQEDNDYLDSQAEIMLDSCINNENKYICEKLNLLPPCLKKRAIIIMARNSGANLTRTQIDIILKLIETLGAVDINDKLRFVSDGKTCIIEEKAVTNADDKDNDWQIKLKGTTTFNKYNKNYEIITADNQLFRQNSINSKKLFNNAIRCDIIDDNILIRGRRPGDRFKKTGSGCTKSLKKLFNELKLSAEQRRNTVLIARGSEVLWIDGIGVSEAARTLDPYDSVYIIKTEEQ